MSILIYIVVVDFFCNIVLAIANKILASADSFRYLLSFKPLVFNE